MIVLQTYCAVKSFILFYFIYLLLLTETKVWFKMLLCIVTKGVKMKQLYKIINKLGSSKEVECFFNELLTESEINVLSKRWRILNMLNDGCTQREIVKDLNVSLCKVTRGSKILKDKNALITKILKGDKTNDKTNNK